MLELIILSALLSGPCHGYEIKKSLKGLNINNNTLYPLLKKMNEQGFVSMELISQENKPTKKIYNITDSGRDHLFEIVSDFTIDDAASDDAFFLRLIYFQFLPKEIIAKILQAREDYLIRSASWDGVRFVLQKFPDNAYDLLYLKNYVNSKLRTERELVKTLRTKYGIDK